MAHHDTKAAPVRVLVDALAVKPGLGGIATYARSVLSELEVRHDVEVFVVTADPALLKTFDDRHTFVAPEEVWSFSKRAAWRERQLARCIGDANADVLFSPTIELPLRRVDRPSAMVVHDLGPAQSPSLYGWARWFRYHSLLRIALKRADRVICVSAATEVQLTSSLGVEGEKVVVIGEAGEPREVVAPTENPEGRPYVLYVGAMLPHKNLSTLVRSIQAPELDGFDLVVVGPQEGSDESDFRGLVSSLGLEDRVSHRGFVPSSELDSLYANASCLAFPTLNEGFGLPLLEAMSRGTPVVASRLPALEEIGLDAAHWVDRPLDPSAWAEAISQLVKDDELAQKLRAYGLERSKAFTWQQVAEDLAGEFRMLANAPA